jgi:hypothetical protein
LISSCATTQGRVFDGSYHAPLGNFVLEEVLGSGPERAFFAVAVLPEASSVVDGSTGKKWDSVRALLVFDENGFMYMLHSEINTVFDPVKADSLKEKDLESARRAVQSLRASIRFL